MKTLVAGDAALWDLIGRADEPAPKTSVGLIGDGPATRGRWLPGGAAPTVALAMACSGADVALWHPMPAQGNGLPIRLANAGVDVSRCPSSDTAGHCIVLRIGDDALMWSSQASPRPPINLDLRDIDHVVLCPAWGEWSVLLAMTSERLGLRKSIVGMFPSEALSWRWEVVVINTAQAAAVGVDRIQARVLVITQGSAGSQVRVNGDGRAFPTVPANVVDPTGAGDVYAGTFLAELERHGDPALAARTASVAAAACCEHWGAQTSLIPPPVPRQVDQASRCRGALWGLACGDAFGMPNSFLPTSLKQRVLGTVTEMVAAPSESPYHRGYAAGRITDDTEQAIALTRAMTRSNGLLNPDLVAEELSAWFERVGGPDSQAVGPSSRAGLMAWRQGVSVTETGTKGTSNGGAMRIAPIGVLGGLANWSLDELLENVTAACMPTHNTSVAISAAAAVAASIAAGVSGAEWPDVLQQGKEAAQFGKGRGRWVYAPDLARRIDAAIHLAQAGSGDHFLADVSELIGAGEPSAEAVPAAFAVASRALGDPATAIRLAGNLEGDSDTIAAMAGAICGAWAGDSMIPEGWKERVASENDLDVQWWYDQLAALAGVGQEVLK